MTYLMLSSISSSSSDGALLGAREPAREVFLEPATEDAPDSILAWVFLETVLWLSRALLLRSRVILNDLSVVEYELRGYLREVNVRWS